MKSRFAEYFNHDEDASEYDVEVRNEFNPIRTGYGETLAWVALQAYISPEHYVLDLGCGTGNTSALLSKMAGLVCVDVSPKMMELAKCKLAAIENLTFIQSDLLEFFDRNKLKFDCIVSTYAIHHLTENEKALLFKEVYKCLAPGGRAVFGDLMFQNDHEKEKVVQSLLKKGHKEGVADIKDEFFWDLDNALNQLEKLGFLTVVKRFSELSWGLAAIKI